MFDKLKQEAEKFFTDNIPKKWRRTVGFILFILPIASFLFWNWEDFINKPLSVWVLDKYEIIKYPIQKPIPQQFNVAIAKFENDDNNKIRQELGKNLQNFAIKFNDLGTKETRSINIALIPKRIELENEMNHGSIQKGHEDALKILSKYNYDVVIWGRAGEKEGVSPSLFWTTLAHEDPYHHVDSFKEELPSIAIQDLTVVLAALISTRSEIYAFIKGQDIADKIRMFTEKLKNLLETSGNKKGWNEKTLWQIKLALADNLKILADASENTDELEEAIKIYENFLNSDISNTDPLKKAKIEDDYGITLAKLGIRSSGNNTLYLKAENAHLVALSLLSREKNPWQWARVQINLATTLGLLGKHDDAEKAFNSAIEVWTKDKYPVEWASVQNNLGNILTNKGDDISLEKAIQIFGLALTIRTKDRFPLDFASTQDNLGNALRKLGTKQKNYNYLIEAVKAHKKSLTIWTKEKSSWDWAIAKTNLGETLIRLSEQESKLDYLQEANQAFMDALTVRTQENFPRAWAETLNDWGIVLSKIGEITFNTIYLKQAIMAFRVASTISTKEEYPKKLDSTQNNLKNALTLLDRAELMDDCNDIANSIYYSALPEMIASSDTKNFDSKIWLDNLNRKIKFGSKKCKNHLQFNAIPYSE